MVNIASYELDYPFDYRHLDLFKGKHDKLLSVKLRLNSRYQGVLYTSMLLNRKQQSKNNTIQGQ